MGKNYTQLSLEVWTIIQTQQSMRFQPAQIVREFAKRRPRARGEENLGTWFAHPNSLNLPLLSAAMDR